MSESIGPFNMKQILEHLPHRYPFLLVDRVLELTPGEWVKALKNVSMNEPFFQGHFPGQPVMPGVLILEAMAQAGGVLVFETVPPEQGNGLFVFRGIDKVKFRKPVVPGDQLILTLEDLKQKGPVYRMRGKATVNGELAAEAHLVGALVATGEI